jgi:putative tricarboxylic transport membrane protein
VKLAYLNYRATELAVGIALLIVAGLVIRETLRLGAGWGPSGPQAGFFPFWSAVVMAVGTVVAMVQALRTPNTRPLFDTPAEAREVVRVGVPLAVAMISVEWLGYYLMTALYMGFFGIWYGRYRWYLVLPVAVLLPTALYFGFERGFRIALPKSIWYGTFIPF